MRGNQKEERKRAVGRKEWAANRVKAGKARARTKIEKGRRLKNTEAKRKNWQNKQGTDVNG